MNSRFDHAHQVGTTHEAVHLGACFCGEVQITLTGQPIEMGYCHCGSCRAYSGAPVTAFVLWNASQVKVTRGAHLLAGFQKSPMSDRRFCSRCGGHVLVHHPELGFTDVHASVLPTLGFVPTVHLNYTDTVLPIHDGLPKLRDFPAQVGGSGELLPE